MRSIKGGRVLRKPFARAGISPLLRSSPAPLFTITHALCVIKKWIKVLLDFLHLVYGLIIEILIIENGGIYGA